MAKIKFRRDTAADWTQVNPVLAQGEPGFEYDTGLLKIGDGGTAWNSLPYSNNSIEGSGNAITNTDGVNNYSVGVNESGVVTMTTARGGLEFGAMPEPGAPQHLHIMRPEGQGSSTDLFFGDDFNYIKLPGNYGDGTQGVEIGSSLGEGTVHTWRFGTDGELTLPAGGDIVDSTGASVLGGSGTSVPSVDIASTTYKGFVSRYGRVYNNSNSNELTVSKIVIFRESAYIGSGSTIHPTSSNDDFAVTGLGPSDVVAMFMLYGDTNGAKSLETLTEFVEAAVDNVLLAGGVEGEDNTIAEMRAAFYTNISTLTAAAGGLVENFEFFENFANTTAGVTTVREGSGAVFEIGDNGLGSYTASGIQNPGTNYLAGHKILVLGTALGGVTPDNDCVITVDSIGNPGEIFQWSVSGVAAGTVSALYAPVTGTNYQVGSGATFQGIGKNDDGTLYANFNSQGTGYVTGDVLTLPGSDLQSGVTPDNNITLTVTSSDAGDGRIYGLTVTGVFPNIWRSNSISDGGNDQYDTANYIDTNLATRISYNGGVIVEDAEAQFGPNSKYVVVYDESIFGVFATGSSATAIGTSGGSGADGQSTTDTGALQSAGVNQQNAVTELAIIQGPLTFPDGTEQTTAFSRVKSTATGSRRIEEVTGYKEVTVTERTEVVLTTTASRSVTNADGIWVDTASTTIDDVYSDAATYQAVDKQFSLDNITWYNAGGGYSYIGNETVMFIDASVTYNQGDTIYFRYTSGGFPVTWWNKSELPGSSSNFRGAVIDYHAYTGEATIIGTIHIVDDDGEENITHTEVSSGSTDSENDDLWLVQNEGTISYRRIDGEEKTLKVHWTAKVFYGSELYD